MKGESWATGKLLVCSFTGRESWLEKVAEAMAMVKTRVYSGGSILPGLVKRRNDEVNVYLYGRYERT